MELRKGKLSMKSIDDANAQKVGRKDAAQERVQSAKVVPVEEWDAVLKMKSNSKMDKIRMQKLRKAMKDGVIERNPTDAVMASGKVKKFTKAEALRLYKEFVIIDRDRVLKELVDNKPENYITVLDFDLLRRLVADSMKEPIIAIDTETTGLDPFVDVIIGFSVTNPTTDEHYYVPITPTEDERALDGVQALEILRPLVESEDVGKVYHNAPFDIKFFQRHGIEPKGLAWDTQTGMVFLNENEMSYALKVLATKYLKEPSDTFAELFGKDANFAAIPIEVASAYAAKDTHITWRLYEFQMLHLAKMPTVLQYVKDVEIPLIPIVAEMEQLGFEIDLEYAKEYGERITKEVDELKIKLEKDLGDINLNSPAQLKPALEAATGVMLESTNANKVLNPLRKQYPVIDRLLRYKELAKLFGTYISVLPEKLHPVTGNIHVRLNPNGTVTGRFSSGGGDTNIQNQPQEARPLYVAPEGWTIVGADFKAQEIRCAANKSGEPILMDAFNRQIDPYAMLASKHFKKPYNECNKNADGSDTVERKTMKVVMLAVMYGMGPNALSGSLKISKEEAKQFLTDFFISYPSIKKWIDSTQAYAKKYGFVWVGEGFRKRRLPDARRKTFGRYVPEVSRALRQGPNAEIQGESAIQTKKTIVALDKVAKVENWKIWATVHDEILVLMRTDEITRESIAKFEEVMVTSYSFGDVPNGTDIEMGSRWGRLISVDEWFEQNKKGA